MQWAIANAPLKGRRLCGHWGSKVKLKDDQQARVIRLASYRDRWEANPAVDGNGIRVHLWSSARIIDGKESSRVQNAIMIFGSRSVLSALVALELLAAHHARRAETFKAKAARRKAKVARAKARAGFVIGGTPWRLTAPLSWLYYAIKRSD